MGQETNYCDAPLEYLSILFFPCNLLDFDVQKLFCLLYYTRIVVLTKFIHAFSNNFGPYLLICRFGFHQNSMWKRYGNIWRVWILYSFIRNWFSLLLWNCLNKNCCLFDKSTTWTGLKFIYFNHPQLFFFFLKNVNLFNWLLGLA